MNASAVPAASSTSAEFDAALIRKLNQSGPRYTSYPTADRFDASFGYRDYLQAVAGLRTHGAARPLSLSLHIPFCGAVGRRSAGDKTATGNRDRATIYLSYLKREIEIQGCLFAGMNQVEQFHLSGAPGNLSDEQIAGLMAHVRRWFRFAPDAGGEYSIEIDPRAVTPVRVHSLRRHGFNLVSIGVRDRFQPGELRALVDAARAAGFRSASIDLVYGLPKQNVIGMAQTLAKVIAASPDRIAICSDTQVPQPFKPRRRGVVADLPGADARLDMLSLCIRRLTEAGYTHIGMDHFARPSDDLAVAQRQGRLHHSFHGYATHAEAALLACGVSAIGSVGATYSQNVKNLDAYYAALDKNELPIARGARLSMDDALRRTIIQTLMCNFELSVQAIEQAYPIDFGAYFSAELARLALLAGEGLVALDPGWLTVTPKGRLLIRNICMVFDRYLTCSPRIAGRSRKI